jgi:uncharacterized protein YprB with RNaseH-like and TPR domain
MAPARVAPAEPALGANRLTHAVTTDELRRIIRRIEEKHRARATPRVTSALEDLVGGGVEKTEDGGVLVVRRRFPLDHRHGAQPLAAARDMAPEALALLARVGEAAPPAARLLYLDAETTGLAGGTGTYAFLVGVGFFDDGAFETRQFFMRDLDEEPALLSAIASLLAGFDGLVTYNGTGFDLPLLETRFVLARRPWQGDAPHVDLLPPARRLWADRLADCRLGTVEQHVLAFRRENDLPGAMIPSVYFDYLRRKTPGVIPRVFEHNRHDVLSLAALAGWVAVALSQAPAADLHPVEVRGLGRLWERLDPERSAACYRMALELGLPSPARERLLSRLARHEKRRARWGEARSLWEAAARSGLHFDPGPWEEMAKIDEHRLRDLGTARRIVEEALALAQAQRFGTDVVAALTHRLERIRRKGRQGPAAPGAAGNVTTCRT